MLLSSVDAKGDGKTVVRTVSRKEFSELCKLGVSSLSEQMPASVINSAVSFIEFT